MMLEAIVQNDDLRGEGGDRMMPDDAAVTSDEHRNARRMRCENEGFIPGLGNTRTDMRAIGYDTHRPPTATLVATAGQHDAPASPVEAHRKARSHGCLARPADGQPADAHHRAGQATAPSRRPSHPRSMRPRRHSVEHRQQPKYAD